MLLVGEAYEFSLADPVLKREITDRYACEVLTGAAFCGRRTVFDPFGVPLSGAGEDAQLVLAGINKERIEEIRTKLPSVANCRFGVAKLL